MSQIEFKGLGLQRENLDKKRRKMNFYKTVLIVPRFTQ